MRKNYRNTFGKWGEEIACQYLIERGYQCIAKNFNTHSGELDLVMKKNDLFTFVEVKTRASDSFGNGEDSITERKKSSLQACIFEYLDKFSLQIETWQLDLIVVEGLIWSKNPRIIHFENLILDEHE